ncbi:MAG TPA: hypothetical protein VE974_04970 [Thermoanaerobaculia bacterium]|nr:hypothetical protein [Thermoanaerobaculia bacterium]
MTRKALAALILLVVPLLGPLVGACGKRGDPRPPVPVIPKATSDLVVTQRADQVILSWSYPSLTTVGRSLTSVDRINILRYQEELPASALGRDPNQLLPGDIDPTLPQPVALFAKIPEIPKAQFVRLATRVESIEKANLASATTGSRLVYADTPPFRSVSGRPLRETYAVVTEGGDGHSDVSNLAIIVPLPVATPPAGLVAKAQQKGVELTWETPKTSVRGEEAPVIEGYHIYRGAQGAVFDEFAPPINNAPVKGNSYTDTPSYGDHAYRVSAVALSGTPTIQSAPSTPVWVTFKDLMPPPAPASLETLIEPDAVRLVWNAVEAGDLAGYRLYRTEGVGHETQIREAGTIPLGGVMTETYFRDARTDPGIAYRYAVTAVDKSGNESTRVLSGWVVTPKTP